mmetsp:Transcript_2910/g.6969  ORF Transcript_2910/g.6969 Transcript_2910/m.6969 type:complete len:238 (+) Transcript_2910:1383-2096(+)
MGSPLIFRARNLDPTKALNWTAGASSFNRATWPSFSSSRVDTHVITIGAPASSTLSARLSSEKDTEARAPLVGVPSLRLLACFFALASSPLIACLSSSTSPDFAALSVSDSSSFGGVCNSSMSFEAAGVAASLDDCISFMSAAASGAAPVTRDCASCCRIAFMSAAASSPPGITGAFLASSARILAISASASPAPALASCRRIWAIKAAGSLPTSTPPWEPRAFSAPNDAASAARSF